MRGELRIEVGGEQVATIPIGAKPVVLGRAPECDVQVADLKLSRKHCQVELRDHKLQVTDLGSSNGTFVDGQRVNHATLNPGESVFIGRTRISFGLLAGEGDRTERIEPQGMLRAPGTGVINPAADTMMVPPTDRLLPAVGRGPAVSPVPVALAPPPATPISGRLPAAMPLPPAVSCDATGSMPCPVEGYQILGELGKGSAGTVYRAIHTESGETCVLKTIEFGGKHKDAIFFIRECQAGMRIKHPNVVELRDFGESSGLLFLALELVSGGNLLERIKAGGPLSAREAVFQLRKVLDALAFAGKKKFVHRDIKPANILLTPEGEPKLADFGLAKTMAEGQKQGVTQQGETRGTPIYMPPEMLMSAKDADQRADIYSLGATYYHAVTGKYPFRGKTVPEILRMVVQQEPTPVSELRPDLPRELADVIRRMMHKDPEKRFQTPDEVVAALKPLAAALGVSD